jgi:hypothetical protein
MISRPYSLLMILAQVGGAGSNAAAVPMLPAPPLLAHSLLESPWPVLAGLLLGGAVAAYLLNRRGRLRDGVRVLIGAIVLAAAVWVLATSVTTEREALQARTRELVELAVNVRSSELESMLAERISVNSPPGAPSPKGREQVLEAVRQTLTSVIAIKEHTTGPVSAVVEGPNVARTQVRVWVKLKGEAAFYEGPIGAWFRIGWAREIGTGDAPRGPWRATSITVLQVDGLGVNPNAPE